MSVFCREQSAPPALFRPWVCHQIGKCIKLRVRVCARSIFNDEVRLGFFSSSSFIKIYAYRI